MASGNDDGRGTSQGRVRSSGTKENSGGSLSTLCTRNCPVAAFPHWSEAVAVTSKEKTLPWTGTVTCVWTSHTTEEQRSWASPVPLNTQSASQATWTSFSGRLSSGGVVSR